MFKIPYSTPSRPTRLLTALALGISLLFNSSASAANHPLDPLSEEEIAATIEVLKAAGKVTAASRYMSIALNEPPKDVVLKFKAGMPFTRRAIVLVREHATKDSFEGVVDLGTKKLVFWTELKDVQPAFPDDDELGTMRKALRADPQWQATLTRRGITDFDEVMIDPWPVGYYGISDEIGGRFANAVP